MHPNRFALRRVLASRLVALVFSITLPFHANAIAEPEPATHGLVASAPSEDAGKRTRTKALIIKYRGEGPDALTTCAESLSTRAQPFQGALANRSDRLDRVLARYRVGRHRALFRDGTHEGLEAGRSRIRRRLQDRLQRRARARNGQAAPAAVVRSSASFPDFAHMYRVALPSDADPEQVRAALKTLPSVEYVQIDHAMELDQAAPSFDDPFLFTEGSWGQPYGDLWGLERIDAFDAWASTLGESTVVAVVDTGLDLTHPDIAANVWVNPGEDLDGDGVAEPSDRNGIDDDGNGFVDDLNGFDFGGSLDANEDGDFDDPGDVSDADPTDVIGHGTHVAGTIAALGGNGQGIVGVAPRVRLMPVKGFSDEGRGTASSLWRAVLYAAENGADVINNSWSCSGPCPENPLADDVLAAVEQLDTVVVTSAGNASTDVVFRSPENTDRVLTVGAIGFDDQLPPFSNRGWGIDLVAPGGGPSDTPGVAVPRRNILSLRAIEAPFENAGAFFVGDEYIRFAGTSMSAPHVAGAVALLRSLRPSLTAAAVRDLVRSSARDLGDPGRDVLHGGGGLHLPTLLGADPIDVALEIEAPPSGAIVDPDGAPIALGLAARGNDVAAVEIAHARGLTGRPFGPLEALDDFDLEQDDARGIRGVWKPGSPAVGAHVFRFRARLRDGRLLDRYRVFGVERIRPRAVTDGTTNVSRPSIGRDGVYFAQRVPPSAEESPAAGDDGANLEGGLGLARWPKAGDRAENDDDSPPRLVAIDGDALETDADGSLVTWRARSAAGFDIGWCRTTPRPFRGDPAVPFCAPRRLVRPEGSLFSVGRVGADWLVWQADSPAGRSIEGCRIDRTGTDCLPLLLVARDTPQAWRLASFDGRTLLLTSGRDLALCRLGKTLPCVPEPIAMPAGAPLPVEPSHDGTLLAFNETTVGLAPLPGCLLGEFTASCPPNVAVLSTLHACALEPAEDEGWFCRPTPIAPPVRAERQGGVVVSGRRIAWSMDTPLESLSLHVCEFDRARETCPSQRVTGALSNQVQPTLRGRQLAWAGARSAGPAIQTHLLPDLSGPESVRLRAGRRFSIPLRARLAVAQPDAVGPSKRRSDPGADAFGVDYALEVFDAAGESLTPPKGWRVVDPGVPGGRLRLRGRLPRGASGPWTAQVRVTDADGLESRWSVRLEIVSPPPRKWRWTNVGRRILRGGWSALR